MKKVARFFALILVISTFYANTVFASEWTWENAPGNHGQSIMLDKSKKSAKDIYNKYGRGEILSEGSVEIGNPEDGTIYINVSTLAHRNVDLIRHTIFLDQWDDKRQDWINIDMLDFVRTKEDEPDGKLSYFMNSITISGYPVNKYYRVRGLHMVEFNEDSESCSTTTHGVYITNK